MANIHIRVIPHRVFLVPVPQSMIYSYHGNAQWSRANIQSVRAIISLYATPKRVHKENIHAQIWRLKTQLENVLIFSFIKTDI